MRNREMKKNVRLSYNPSNSPDFTRPVLVQSPRFSMVLVEPPKTRVLRSEVVPPWLQPIELKLENLPSSGMQVSDLWTHRMRKRIVEDFFPSRVKSKVASVFHEYYSNAYKQKQIRRLKKHTSSPTLSSRTPRVEESVSLSYSSKAEPEPVGVRFPPIRGQKTNKKAGIDVSRPSLSP